MGGERFTGTSDATRIQPLPSNCVGHVRCTGRDAHAAGLPLHLSNCWSLSDRHQPLCGLCSLACAPKHAVFLMRLSRAASGAQQADQRRNRYARGCGRVRGVAPWAGGGCYAAVPSDQALMPSVHAKWMLWDGASDWHDRHLRCDANSAAAEQLHRRRAVHRP